MKEFVEFVNKKYAGTYDDPVCDSSIKGCVLPVSCDKAGETVFMVFKINDKNGNSYSFSLTSKFLKVSGILMGDSSSKCYLPVFDHGLEGADDSNVIIMGNLVM